MKEEDYSGSLESMVWLRAGTNSLNLGENSWQINREICVGCSEEMEHSNTSYCTAYRWEEWRIESRSLHRPRIEETDQVLGEFLFGGHESNTKKRTLLKMWNERQREIKTANRMLKREEKINSRRIVIRKIQVNSDKKEILVKTAKIKKYK